MNRSVKCGERDILIGRVTGDALVACAKYRHHAIVSVDCGTAGTGLTLVAAVRGVAVINAARLLQQIASRSRQVAQLSGRPTENCFR